MTDISFRLIRKNNPILNPDNLEDCAILTLASCGIENIDNLELFSHLTELNLSDNNITAIENLNLFSKLQYLDVSKNKITSQGLERSADGIPLKLNTINLSGNPCINDEDALTSFQSKFPNLFIVIEDIIEPFVEPTDDIDEVEGKDDDYERDVRDAIAEIPGDLASDAVLGYIVNRKCKLQGIDPLNLDNEISKLNEELSKTIEQRESTLNLRRHNHPPSVLNIEENSAQIRARTEAMLERNKEERTKFTEFMTRLKATAAAHKTSLQVKAEAEAKQTH